MTRLFRIWHTRTESLGIGFWIFKHWIQLKVCFWNYFSVYTERTKRGVKVFKKGPFMLTIRREDELRI